MGYGCHNIQLKRKERKEKEERERKRNRKKGKERKKERKKVRIGLEINSRFCVLPFSMKVPPPILCAKTVMFGKWICLDLLITVYRAQFQHKNECLRRGPRHLKVLKPHSFRGCCPLEPHQGLCPWTPPGPLSSSLDPTR